MSYERLELIDGVTKWDTEKVQHLEDAIIKNENDIQKYHNDTVVEMQADWNQKDETAKDYVKNRTHYTSINTISLVENFETECYEYFLGGGPDRMVEGLTNEEFEGVVFDSTMDIESLQVFINGVQEPISRIEKYDSDTIYWYLNNGVYISVMNNNYWLIRLDYDNNTLEIGDKLNVSLFIDQATVVPLDIKYIPEEVLQQSDWSCYEADSHSYIKNRTHYTEYGWDNDMTAYDSFPRYYTIPYDKTAEGPGYWLGSKIFVLEEKYILTSKSDWKFVEELADGGIYTWEQYDKENNKLVKLEVEVHSNSNGGYDTIWNYNQGYGHFEEAYEVVKTLDEKYLPNSVAQNIDWNEWRENSPSYIKNKTHYPYQGVVKTIYDGRIQFNGDYDKWTEFINLLPYEQIIETDLTPDDAPGYWLGSMGGYSIVTSMPGGNPSCAADAYSNWQAVDTETTITSYCYTNDHPEFRFEVDVEEIGFNKYRVILKNVYGTADYFEKRIEVLGLNYKKLDDVYLPDTIARDPDWEENNPDSPSYIKNRPFYVEHSAAEPYELIYHPINEKFIPDTIAKVTDIPVMDITLTNEGAAADAKAVGEAISNLENKVDNKQIEEYFEEVIGAETLIGSSYHGESIEVRPALFDRPINLKLVNKLSGKIFILKDEDFSGERGEFNYEGPADFSDFVIRFSGENVSFFEKGVNDSTVSYDLYKIEFKTLDEKYISNTIVRKTELKNALLPIEECFHVYEEELYVSSFEERLIGFLGQFLNEVKRPIRLKFVNTLTGEIQIVKEKDLNITYTEYPPYEVITYNNPNGLIVQQFSMSSTDILLEYFHGQCDDIVVYGLIPIDDKKELNEEYIPDTIARAPKATFNNIEEAPTASDFNTLLSILREAGILATE